MRIARVSNTELFVGTEQDPQQVLRVELADVDQAGTVEVRPRSIRTPPASRSA